jgi:hypothetical protein
VPERESRGTSLGAVGDFVFIDCERSFILGRIVETSPARRRAADRRAQGR